MAKKKGKSKATKQQTTVNSASLTDAINEEVIAEALSSVNMPVLMKVCRLCQAKDGPFLNIFDAEKVRAKKIDDLMPFVVAENDELPHKICFRCSAKVEELHEFVQKCIQTQESLRNVLGKVGPLMTKTKVRTQWEEKLNKSNMSNDDICNALIKKAMEGIKNIPLNPLPVEDEKPSPQPLKKMKIDTKPDEQDEPDVSLKQVKLAIEKCDTKASTTRTSRAHHTEMLMDYITSKVVYPQVNKSHRMAQNKDCLVEDKPVTNMQTKQCINTKATNNETSDDSVKISKDDKPKPEVSSKVPETRLFNIMEHVSTIKVNGVGVLFQCKLCNRNFLKKEVVEVHGCAKNVIPKVDFTKNLPLPEPPKAVNTVKYIKLDNESKKPFAISNKNSNKQADLHIKNVSLNSSSNNNKNTGVLKPEVKQKPKIGPASKIKRDTNNSQCETSLSQKEPSAPLASGNTPESNIPNSLLPTVTFPLIPSLNSRFKLVPGPNNTFSLVEESVAVSNERKVEEKPPQKTGKKRKSPDQDQKSILIKSKESKLSSDESKSKATSSHSEIIEVDTQIIPTLPSEQKPYPVGLFQTLSCHSSKYVPTEAPKPPAFTTPAMKKQSYTVVQTGNPSKLVISTKPQPQSEEISKKRNRKKIDVVKDNSKEPFNVTIEDAAPPKDAGFFTFINVDPLLQPSYVLPTDNIIQESQISTSTPVIKDNTDNKDKDKYSCNMCGDAFSREKKLLAHIQSHYSKMDEEDQMRAEKNTSKRKGRKS